MKLKITTGFIFTFLLLLLLTMEFHEIVHITMGRIICGSWGMRDFNVWSLCDHCRDIHPLWWIATLSGPAFSFAMMWLGRWFLLSSNPKTMHFGFAFIFANIPFGRVTTVMMGGGDEMMVTRHLLQPQWSRSAMIILCSCILIALTVPPVFRAWHILKNKFAWLYITGFLLLPLLFLLIYLLTILNKILESGFLSETWIMGTPLLVTVHTLIVAVLFLLFRKNLTVSRTIP